MLVLRRLRQENPNFKDILGYRERERLCFKNQKSLMP
jgi:hypothetical protein